MPAAGSSFRRGPATRPSREKISAAPTGRRAGQLETIVVTIATALCALAIGLFVVTVFEYSDPSRSTADAKTFGQPSLTLSTTSGNAGASVLASGTNFAHAAVQLQWDSSAAGMPTAFANGRGSFQVTFVVPSGATVGRHTVSAQSSGATVTTASAQFTVASAPVQPPIPAPTSVPTAAPTATPAPTVAPTATPPATATPTPPPPPTPAALSPLRVSGNLILNAASQPVQLRGVNYSGTEYACIQGWGIFDGPSDQAMVSAMKAWKANFVRIPLNEDCWLGLNGVPAAYAGPNYINAIKSFVALLHQNGMYAELSLIWGAPGAYKATYQPGSPDADHSPAMWTSMAATFVGDSAVILAPWGETIVNANCFLNGGVCEATYGPSNTPYQTAGMQQAVTVMRAAGYHGIISIPGINYANDLTQWLSHRPADPDNALIAEAHIYGNNTCGAQNNGACLTNTVAPVAQVVPVVFSETGETYDASECTSANMQIILPWADAHGIGYAAWTWDTWGNCSALISDFTGTVNISTPAGAKYPQYVHDHLVTR